MNIFDLDSLPRGVTEVATTFAEPGPLYVDPNAFAVGAAVARMVGVPEFEIEKMLREMGAVWQGPTWEGTYSANARDPREFVWSLLGASVT